jgi:hypothetical protein
MVEQDIAAVCIRLSGGTTEHRPVSGGDTSYLLLGHAVGNYGNRTTCRHAFRISPAAFGLGDIRIKSPKEVLKTIFSSSATEHPPGIRIR